MGYFIAFEGIEGCGKSTQVRMAGEKLRLQQMPFAVTEEPGGSNLGKEIRKILLNRTTIEISARAELFLFMADRVQHVCEVISPALNEKKIVLCDRFADATLAYQGSGRGLDRNMIEEMNRFAYGGLKPDLTILFDLPVEVGLARAMERIAAKNQELCEDRFEAEETDFHRRVREGYLCLARRDPQRFLVLDGARDIDSVHGEVWAAIQALIEKK
jgi:dTMP kinase